MRVGKITAYGHDILETTTEGKSLKICWENYKNLCTWKWPRRVARIRLNIRMRKYTVRNGRETLIRGRFVAIVFSRKRYRTGYVITISRCRFPA